MDFFQRQYAGATSLAALDRFESMYRKLKTDEISVKKSLEQASKSEENIRSQHDLLTGRLQVVEQLKDILEQQIGSPDVQDLIHRFSENSQSMLGVRGHLAVHSQPKVVNIFRIFILDLDNARRNSGTSGR